MNQNKATETVKFLCSYGGKILLRHSDGNLRYVGGLTRVLAVDASISFGELMVKLAEFCGYSVTLRCQLPDGDLETLISIKSNEDLANILEEYDHASSSSPRPLKIRAILSPPKSMKQISPTPSMAAGSSDSSPSKSIFSSKSVFSDSPPKRYLSPPLGHPVGFQRGPSGTGRVCNYPCHVQRIPCEISYHHHRYHHPILHCNDYWR